MQFDPALKEQILRRTGHVWSEVSDPDVPLSVVARLASPDIEIPGLSILARFGNVITGRIEASRVGEVRAHPGVASLKAAKRVAPMLGISGPEVGAQRVHRPPTSLTGRGVLVAVIDWYCDFAHANFRNADGSTRLRFLWDQRGGEEGASPAPFGYGRVFDRALIDEALQHPDPYRALEYDPARGDPDGRGSHGTHVLDIAAGNGRASGAAPGIAPEADLGFVHLRGHDTRPEDSLGDSVRLLEAVRFVLDQAGDRPVVLNLSLGMHAGPHDGTTLVELALDAALAEAKGRAITMSTGNYFAAGVHTRGSIGEGQSFEIPWQVHARQHGATELELWYSGEDAFVVDLVRPDGVVALSLRLGEDGVARRASEVIATGYHRRGDPNNGDNLIDLFLWASAEPGTWTVRLFGERIDRGHFDAWIERDDHEAQSRFARGHTVATTTTGTICNGRSTIAVGAYDARTNELEGFSSCGPTRDGRRKPDLAAPGHRIAAARSTFFGPHGRVTNSVTTKSGTSMASPHVCGAIALLFEAASPRRLGIEETREHLFASLRDPPTQSFVPRLRYGRGLLDVAAAVRRLTGDAPTASEPDRKTPDSGTSELGDVLTALDRLLPPTATNAGAPRPRAQRIDDAR